MAAERRIITNDTGNDCAYDTKDTIFSRITDSTVRDIVRNAVIHPNAMTHAWLFTGPPGSGRTIAARVFAQALVCPQNGCGHCQHCRMAEADTHPDILRWTTGGSTLTKAEADHVVRDAATLPMLAKMKIIIVEKADKLHERAANSLLKSVEEPPAGTVFLLCSPSMDADDIAITLRSRCRHVYVPTPSCDAVRTVLLADTRLALTEQQADWAASVSGGHIGRAKHLARDEHARKKRKTALTLPQLVYANSRAFRFTAELVAQAEAEAGSLAAEYEQAERKQLEDSLGFGAQGKTMMRARRGTKGYFDELEKKQKARRKQMAVDALDLALVDIAGLYRDAMMVAIGAVDGQKVPVGGWQHPDMVSVSSELARRNSSEALLQCIDAVMACRIALHQQVRSEVALDAMVGCLQQCCGLVN